MAPIGKYAIEVIVSGGVGTVIYSDGSSEPNVPVKGGAHYDYAVINPGRDSVTARDIASGATTVIPFQEELTLVGLYEVGGAVATKMVGAGFSGYLTGVDLTSVDLSFMVRHADSNVSHQTVGLNWINATNSVMSTTFHQWSAYLTYKSDYTAGELESFTIWLLSPKTYTAHDTSIQWAMYFNQGASYYFILDEIKVDENNTYWDVHAKFVPNPARLPLTPQMVFQALWEMFTPFTTHSPRDNLINDGLFNGFGDPVEGWVSWANRNQSKMHSVHLVKATMQYAAEQPNVSIHFPDGQSIDRAIDLPGRGSSDIFVTTLLRIPIYT